MDDILDQIRRACRLARELETSLPQLVANHPDSILISCEEIHRAFYKVINGLSSDHKAPSYDTFLRQAPESPRGKRRLDVGAGEGSSHGMQAINLLQGPSMEGDDDPSYRRRMPAESETAGIADLLEIQTTSMSMEMMQIAGGGSPETNNVDYAFGRGGGEAPAPREGSSGSGRRPPRSSIQRSSRRRRDSGQTSIVRVPAVRTGNMEMPPDDGYTWRKYGQKAILGSRFPRSYYRCTHKSFYGCEAKKQVQRLDDDPYTYVINYCGTHSCQTSTTPLLIPAIAPNNNNNNGNNNPQGEANSLPEAGAVLLPPSSLPASPQLGIWFSEEEFERGQREFQSLIGRHGGEGSSTQAGPSHVQGGRDADDTVADLANVMFNSGSSGSSMDALFSPPPKQDN